jgi:putative resolvase
MNLKAWAKKQGIHYRTALRWYHSGKLPITAARPDNGVILVGGMEKPEIGQVAALYARVSSHDQKDDLERQLDRLRLFAASKGVVVSRVVKEIGSGLNGHRKGLLGLLVDQSVSTVVVEHRDRLARFGVEYLEAALESSGRKLLVVDTTEKLDDIAQDFVDLATSMCARIYGRRSAKNRAKRMLEAASED